MQRVLPKVGTPESKLLCLEWDKAGMSQRLQMAQEWGLSYGSVKNYRTQCKVTELPRIPVEYTDYSWDEHIDTIIGLNKLASIHEGLPSEITIEIKTDEPIALTFTADWQLGELGVDYEAFRNDINTMINTKGLYVQVGGDGYQNVIQPSKIGSSHNQVPINVQKALYVQTLKRLAGNVNSPNEIHKLIAVGTGNHNYWSAMATGEDWDAELAKRLNVIYTKHCGVIKLIVGKQMYPILRYHKGRFNSSDNLTNSCKKHQKNDYPDARIVVVEHLHRADMEQYRYNDNECVAIRPGTYATYDDYALQNGYFAAHVANPTVILYPNEDHLVGFKDMRDAITHLKALRGEN